MKKYLSRLLLSTFALCLFCGQSFAISSPTTHVVTITVPTLISMTANQANFTLAFSDFANGSVSGNQVVNYTVKANNVTRTAGVVQAQLNTLFANVNFQASAGPYSLTGGNANLLASNSGFVTVGTSATNLYNRNKISGNGNIVSGSFPVTYQATATSDLSPSSSTSTLTVTFIDT